jgi:DNA-binding transcriptional LysR family regulator
VELRQLAHFVAVAEEQSFTRAAARSHLVQSALSVSIRALERDVGASLFDRSTHPVSLTDAGELMLPEARRTLAAAEAARDAVAAVQGGVRGRVRIGIMQSLSLLDLGSLLASYQQTRPGVQILPTAAQGGSAELVAGVLEGRLDVAFTAMPGGYPPGISAFPLASEEMRLACPPGHPLDKTGPITLAELNAQRFVDFPLGWGTRTSVDLLFASAGLHREIVVEVPDVSTLLDLVRAGFGLALVGPSWVPEAERRSLRGVSPAPEFTVSLITSSERPLSAAARALVQLVTTATPEPSHGASASRRPGPAPAAE